MQPVYTMTAPNSLSGTPLNLARGYWGFVVPEPTINLLPDPGLDDTPFPLTPTNCTVTQVTSPTFKGKYAFKVVPNSAGLDSTVQYFLPPKMPDDATKIYNMSAYVKGGLADQLKIQVLSFGPTLAAESSYKPLNEDWLRLDVTSSAASGLYFMRIVKKAGNVQPFYVDSVQFENKAYPTTFCSGDELGCRWLGLPYKSASKRDTGPNIFGGRFYLFSDLDFINLGMAGAGAGPYINKTINYAQSGGAEYKGSTQPERSIVLNGVIEGDSDPATLYRKRQALISLISPDIVKGQGKPIILIFQHADPCGVPTGKMLEIPVYYSQGLEGDIDNNHTSAVKLVFSEYLPPSVRESGNVNASVAIARADNYSTTVGMASAQIFQLFDNLSEWRRLSEIGSSLFYQANAWVMATDLGFSTGTFIWFGGADNVGTGLFYFDPVYKLNPFFVNKVALNGAVLAVAAAAAIVYSGGAFTVPAFIGYVNGVGGLTLLPGSTINNTVRGMALSADGQTMVVVGDFTAPWGRACKFNLAAGTQSVLMPATGTTGFNATMRGALLLNDGRFLLWGDAVSYIGVGLGTFTINYVCIYDAVAETVLPIGNLASSALTGTNGIVRGAIQRPDGAVVIVGDFTAAGGVACQHIAITFNFKQFFPVGAGLTNSVYSICREKGANFIVGSSGNLLFDNSLTSPSKLFKWVGGSGVSGSWQMLDLSPTNQGVGVYPESVAFLHDQLLTGYNALGAGVVGQPQYSYGAVTIVQYDGSAAVAPKLVIRGPGRLWQIANETTGQGLYFDNKPSGATFQIANGEIITVTLAPGKLDVRSSVFGPQLNRIRIGSNLGGFGLQPGPNVLRVFMTGITAQSSVDLLYTNVHPGIEASAY